MNQETLRRGEYIRTNKPRNFKGGRNYEQTNTIKGGDTHTICRGGDVHTNKLTWRERVHMNKLKTKLKGWGKTYGGDVYI